MYSQRDERREGGRRVREGDRGGEGRRKGEGERKRERNDALPFVI